MRGKKQKVQIQGPLTGSLFLSDPYTWGPTFLIFLLMLDLWPQAETPGVTHFGAYHRPPDGHFFSQKPIENKERQILSKMPFKPIGSSAVVELQKQTLFVIWKDKE